jgi:predicted adenylyl cyclase CyaB
LACGDAACQQKEQTLSVNPGQPTGEQMRNVEAKFPLSDLAATFDRAAAIGFEYAGTLIQHDTFFVVSNGKMKLREQPDGAWLIHYQRHREHGLELSNYEIVAVAESFKLRRLLSAALGVLAQVQKRRLLLRRANVRLHLDQVDDHGQFGELEAVIDEGQDLGDARSNVTTILQALGIPFEQLIKASYFELVD